MKLVQYYDTFTYNGANYSIEMSKKIVSFSRTLVNFGYDEEREQPYVGENFWSYASDVLIKDFFDVNYFTFAVREILFFIEESFDEEKKTFVFSDMLLYLGNEKRPKDEICQTINKIKKYENSTRCHSRKFKQKTKLSEMVKNLTNEDKKDDFYRELYSSAQEDLMELMSRYDYCLDEREKNLLETLNPNDLSQEKFLNTHEVLFNFFDYYDFSYAEIEKKKYKNYAIAILAKIFQKYYTGDNEFTRNYFGYSAETGYLLRNLPVGKLPAAKCKYLYYNFIALDIQRSMYVLAESENSDPMLSHYKEYILADGIYYPKKYSFDVTHEPRNFEEIIMHGIDSILGLIMRGSFSSKKLIIRGVKVFYTCNFGLFTNSLVSESVTEIYSIKSGRLNKEHAYIPYEILRNYTKHLRTINSVHLPNLKTLEIDIFSQSNVEEITLPSLEFYKAGSFAFSSEKLKKVYLPELKFFHCPVVFSCCPQLQEVDLPSLKSVSENFFTSGIFNNRKDNLIKINLPELKSVNGEHSFLSNCTLEGDLNLPKLIDYYGNNALIRNTTIYGDVNLSSITKLNSGSILYNCVVYGNVNLPELQKVSSCASLLKDCKVLGDVNISSLEKVENSYVISNCKIMGNTILSSLHTSDQIILNNSNVTGNVCLSRDVIMRVKNCTVHGVENGQLYYM